MKKFLSTFAVIGMLAVSPAIAQAPAVKQGTLPNGASSLAETYNDWMVSCDIQGGAKICGMAQQQARNGQMWLTANLQLSADGNLSGVVVLPFGVLATKPVSFQIDEARTTITSNIRTCMPVGCIVPIAFDRNTVAALRSGKALKVNVQNASVGEEPIKDMAISLNGFAPALDRMASLSK